jgi:hypothetical protein
MEWKMLLYVLVIWNILRQLGIFLLCMWLFCSNFVCILFRRIGILYQKISGNPAVAFQEVGERLNGRKYFNLNLTTAEANRGITAFTAATLVL